MVRDEHYLKDISARFGIGTKHIRTFLAAAGVVRPKHHKPGACHRNRELVLKMASDGRSLNEIGEKIGTTGIRVRLFLDRIIGKRHYSPGLPGSRNPSWKGGRVVTKKGYVYLHRPDHPQCNPSGYILEHRLVMEGMIHRLLLPNEVVHHRNKNRSDNRPENLQLFSENKDHLASELVGKRPNWTEEGLARMRLGVLLSANRRRGQKRLPHWKKTGPKPGARRLPENAARLPAEPQKAAPPL